MDWNNKFILNGCSLNQKKYMSRKEMKNRITNWKTTAIGFMLIVASVVSVFTHGATWVDVTPTIVIGLGLIFSKDEWIAGKVSIILLLSCNPVKQVLKDQDSKIDRVDQPVYCRCVLIKLDEVKLDKNNTDN